MRAPGKWLAFTLLFAGGVLGYAAGCGGEEFPGTGGSGGPPCVVDSDCVPDGCCGKATGVTNTSNPPDCSGVTCDGSCPVDKVNCGCGIPICSDSQCTVAVTTGNGCPGQGKARTVY